MGAKKKNQSNTTGRGSAPPPFTVSEELAFANNEGRPMMAGVAGGLSSDPTASVGLSDAYVVDTNIVLREPPTVAFNLQEENIDDDETLSACESRVTMEVRTDNVRELYKRNLELDNEKKLLEIKKLKLEIQLLERNILRQCQGIGSVPKDSVSGETPVLSVL
ncbi:hypothetical protein N1851_013042 [Merluccius polli]|uniref:Uncharacterized protein n=1 Tax=Merluccius polli TaxID=89951 RepID=A0AA47MVT9_MERPO|nr:hypothetical protein N1851_013042 [Merluccius polli]